MSRYQTITFRCKEDIYNQLEEFALKYGIDRTSAIKLALHYYLNMKESEESQEQEAGVSAQRAAQA